VDFGGLSHVGLVRSNNEDHFLVARIDRTLRTLITNLPPGLVPDESVDSIYGMLVADGLGGHAAGEVASRTAIATLIDLVLATPDIITRLDDHFSQEVLRRFEQRFRRIAEVLAEQARGEPHLAGMGTTMTAACTAGADLLIAHIGDSRAYLMREGRLLRLTRDHTVAQLLADSGRIGADEIQTHPLRHMLTGVLGTRGGPTAVDLSAHRLLDGDQILLCTDGLTEMVPEDSIAAVLQQPAESAAETCSRLVQAALDRGGKDNVTAVVGRYRLDATGQDPSVRAQTDR
jgi:PPM family protein phosphatase